MSMEVPAVSLRPGAAPASGGVSMVERPRERRWSTLVDDKILLMLVWASFAVTGQLDESGAFHPSIMETVRAAARGVLVIFVCYDLVPRYFTRSRYVSFAVAVLLAFLVYAVPIETLAEPWFDPYRTGKLPWTTASIIYEITSTASLVAILLTIKLGWDGHTARTQLAALARERSETELRFLRGQINPHVVFNCLNNIYAAVLEKTDKAPDMIVKLSGTLRYMIYESAGDRVPLRRELDYLRDYIDLQKMSLEGRGDIEVDLPDEPSDLLIAPGILVVFVENCFKHSLDTQDRGIAIRISARLEGANMLFMAENSMGPAAPETAHLSKATGGLGLANAQRRLALLYPGRHSLQTIGYPGRFVVELKIELDHAPESAGGVERPA